VNGALDRLNGPAVPFLDLGDVGGAEGLDVFDFSVVRGGGGGGRLEEGEDGRNNRREGARDEGSMGGGEAGGRGVPL